MDTGREGRVEEGKAVCGAEQGAGGADRGAERVQVLGYTWTGIRASRYGRHRSLLDRSEWWVVRILMQYVLGLDVPGEGGGDRNQHPWSSRARGSCRTNT